MTNEMTEQNIRKRSPVLAMVLSIMVCGLGHVYVGRFVKGIVLIVAFFIFGAIGVFVLLPVGMVARTICVGASAVGLGIWLYAILDARRIAKKVPADYALKDYNRWYVYLLLVLLQIPLNIGGSLYLRSNLIEAFRMPVNAMTPTIQPGDRVLAYKLAYKSEPVLRGDIVVLINPNNRSQMNIKRVLALPGDRIEVRYGQVILNGKLIDRPDETVKGDHAQDKIFLEDIGGREYRIAVPTSQPSDETSLPETTVPNGYCIVLNDNRANTYDTRKYGPVPLRDIIGRIDYLYWPRWATLTK
jgi:signal peptidase I